MLPLESLNGLVTFVTTARSGSFTEAADALGLSRSAVGKAVARLEARLGVRLFHRTTRRIALTTDGEAY
ncbi:LysR family transcriptional regulator, partial [Acinetobacter baumannii]